MYIVGRCLLSDLLQKRDISQTNLAEHLGVSRQFVNGIINNREKMSLEIAYNISVILSCDIKDLYEWKVSPE